MSDDLKEDTASLKRRSANEEKKPILSAQEIIELLPHRYPFLMVDKVIEFTDNERIVAIKAVAFNEPCFQGHFPGRPVMPGVLILESIAQAAALLAIKSSDGVAEGKKVFLVSATDVKWKRQVLPGDTLEIEVVSQRKRRPYWVMNGVVRVDGRPVCVGTISAVEAE